MSGLEGTVADFESSAPISHKESNPLGFAFGWLQILDQMFNYNWSTKVFLNLVWAALNESQKTGKGKETHIYWVWLWSRYSHFTDGEIGVRWLAQGHCGGLYCWINYLFSPCKRIIHPCSVLCDVQGLFRGGVYFPGYWSRAWPCDTHWPVELEQTWYTLHLNVSKQRL